MLTMLTFEASTPASRAKAGKSFRAPSVAVPPSVRPSRSFGVLIGLSARTAIAKGGRLYMAETASGASAPGGLPATSWIRR
jgi:hypothetical protein